MGDVWQVDSVLALQTEQTDRQHASFEGAFQATSTLTLLNAATPPSYRAPASCWPREMTAVAQIPWVQVAFANESCEILSDNRRRHGAVLYLSRKAPAFSELHTSAAVSIETSVKNILLKIRRHLGMASRKA